MIELVFADACTACGDCITVCPTNVFDAGADGRPQIARQADCQTCFMCELYCSADALFVAPDCTGPTPLDAEQVRAAGLPGQFRRDSGWGEFAASHPNQHWRMDQVFRMARNAPAAAPTAP
ncbi:4Fe-4S dicluster domain-containing protein [Pantoea sp. 18069]|uniref:4Fe-4S dicluster domain-containing protein n=1 Tax=Pantoea sp. 18069 TaxID=2681415 RepID=UPI00135BD544|nr:4Fe-4S dicluster domain-containing protein [Pantoea sp. 18069]